MFGERQLWMHQIAVYLISSRPLLAGQLLWGFKRKVKCRFYFRVAVIYGGTVTFGILQQMDIITWDENNTRDRSIYKEHSLKS